MTQNPAHLYLIHVGPRSGGDGAELESPWRASRIAKDASRKRSCERRKHGGCPPSEDTLLM